jgi:hypothetical protein
MNISTKAFTFKIAILNLEPVSKFTKQIRAQNAHMSDCTSDGTSSLVVTNSGTNRTFWHFLWDNGGLDGASFGNNNAWAAHSPQLKIHMLYCHICTISTKWQAATGCATIHIECIEFLIKHKSVTRVKGMLKSKVRQKEDKGSSQWWWGDISHRCSTSKSASGKSGTKTTQKRGRMGWYWKQLHQTP